LLCAPGHIFGSTEGVRSRFHVLRARTRYRRNRGRRVPFSCFACPDSFSAVPRASGPVFMLCEPRLVFGGTKGVESRFHVLRARTRFRRYRGRRISFACFLRLKSYSAVPRASGHVFMFCAPRLIFDSTEGVGSCFHVLHVRTRFRLYRGFQVPFSCFALLDSFSAVSSVSFMFCASGLVFDGTEGVRSCFHVLRAQTWIRRYRGRPASLSSCATPGSFLAVPRASNPIFKLCDPGFVFGGTEGVGSRLYVFRARTRFRRYQGRRFLFSCFARQTRFRRYRGRRVPFACFAWTRFWR
jgi:hypothetical protein